MSQLIFRYRLASTRTKLVWAAAVAFVALLFTVRLIETFGPSAVAGDALPPSVPALLLPAKLPAGDWRICWTSVNGGLYEIERALDDDPAGPWTNLSTITATGTITCYDDPTATRKRFYRVKLLNPVTTPYTFNNADYFVALDTNGVPVEGQATGTNSVGVLPPFVFRPGGRDPAGSGQGFSLFFPNGARLATNSVRQSVDSGDQFIEFTNATAIFGSESPLQLASPLVRTSGPPVRLPIGPISLEDLAAAFGFNPTNGLDLILFGRFPLRWLAGTLEDGGIRGGRFGLAQSGLPLPGTSGDYPELRIDFTRRDGVRIPFSGEFSLPDGTPTPASLRIPANRPVWLALKANGQLALEGRADLMFAGGPSFSVDFSLDDPHYHLQIVAGGIHLPLLGSLAALLPNSPANCLLNKTTSNQLSEATACLKSFDGAYFNFSAAAVGAASATNAGAAPASPPDAFSLGTSVLDAWVQSALAGGGLSADALRELLRQSGNSATASRGLPEVLCQQAALLRAKQAVTRGALSGDSAALADLDAAIATATAAAIRRAESLDAVVNLKNMTEAARCLLEIEALQQSIGANTDPALTTALSGLVERFAQSFTAGLGVTAGQFTLPTNSPIATMNRFEVLETLKELVGFLGAAQALGLDGQVTAPTDEAMSQFALRLWDVLGAKLLATEAAHDYPGFLYALEDTIELIGLRQTGIFPNNPALNSLPDTNALNSFAARLEQVFVNDPTQLTGTRSLVNQAAEIRRLMGILREMPASVTFAAGPFQRAYDRLEEALAGSVNTLSAIASGPALMDLLEAGMLHAEMRDRFSLTEAVPWEGTRLGQVVDRLAAVGQQQNGWSELHRAAQLCLNETDRLNRLDNQVRRRLYLEKAAQLLQAARAVAVALWSDESSRRGGPPGLQIADLLLPGDLHVDKIAGAIRYDRLSRWLEGAFSGQLRLPKFDFTLTVANASFSSGGAFDLSAFGSVAFPPGNPQGQLIIPEARPLHVAGNLSGRVQLSGAGRVQLNNGMAFEAFLQLEDPLYRFGVSAQGIRFDFADHLRIMVPTLPEGQQFTTNAARDLNDYFRSLSATLDGVRDATTAPTLRQPGDPPNFSAPTAVLPTDDIEAWANARLADVHLNLTRDYTATLAAAKQNLHSLASFLRQRRGDISPEELEMRLRILGKICASIEVRRAAGQTAEADAIATAPEFLEFLQETEAAVLAMLQRAPPRDEAYQDAALEAVQKYNTWASCFDNAALARVIAALGTFQQALWTAFADTNGISPTTGLIVDGTKLPLAEFTPFRPAFLRYLKLRGQHESLGLTTPADSWVRQAGQTLAMRWRSVLLAQIRPLDVKQAENYTKLGLVTRDLLLLLCAGQAVIFDYPGGDIEQLEGPNRPYDAATEMRNTFLRRIQAEEYILVTERFSPGHVDKFTFVTQPAFNVLPQHLKNIDQFACKLKEPLEPVAQFLWGVFSPDTRDALMNYRAGSFLLTGCDFVNPAGFATLLTGPANLPTDALTQYLWNRFSAQAQQVLFTPTTTEYELRWTLSRELNEVIKDQSIHTAQRFSGIALSSRTSALLAQNPQGADLVKLNRWLLDDAFPNNIVKSFEPLGTTGEGLKVTLANALYELIQGNSIYTPQRFAGVRLSPETQELLANTPPDKMRQLNRRLLEDAFPEELPRADVQVMTRYFPALELLRMPTAEDPNQCGIDFDPADAHEREVLQVGDVDFADQRLSAAETRLLQTGTSGDLQGAIKLVKELIWLAGWAEKKQLPIMPRIQANLGRLTIEFTAAAQAQKAWWYLHEYTGILLDAAESTALAGAATARAAVLAEANNALRTSARLLDTFTLLLPGQRPFDLPLPGDIYINRVFGEVQYRRDTGAISGSFGGRIEFPDLQNAFFEISNATLDNQLNFSIAAATGGPLPFDGVRLTASMLATGGLNQPFFFRGTGTMSVQDGPDLGVLVNWEGATHTLSFDTQAGNLQSLRFTDELVLFDAGFGFTIRPAAQSGELRANGSAGFFARGALPATNAPITRTNFHLFADNVRALVLYQPGRVDLVFSNGTLYLPTFFYPTNMAQLCPNQGPATGPSIALNPANPIRATFLDGSPPSVGFQGEIDFRQFGFASPDLPGLAAAVCTAKLKFSSAELPYLTNVTGSLQIPIPNQTNFVDVLDGVFTLTGYPSGRIQLRKDLTLMDLDGFQIILLGQGHPDCPLGSGLTVYPSSGFTQPPAFKLDGGLRVQAPLDMLTSENGDAAFGLACGSLALTNGQLPELEVRTLQFGGTFHLGQGGPVVSNALISFEGLPNLFRLDNQHQFVARLAGSLQIPSGPGFTLQDARFTFFDPNRLPQFSVAGIGINNENFTLLNYLPAKVKRAQINFKAPLAQLPGLLAPTNVTVGMSVEIRFPATANPWLIGAVDDLVVDFDPNGIPRVRNLDGFEMGVGNLKLPPIRELGGRIRVGGLSAGDPNRIYMVGRLGGSYQGYTLIGQFAANLYGPLGFCLDVNAGAVGIPVGPTGILITGAAGGESFVNGNGDPCDFSTYFSKDANGNLVAPSSAIPPGMGMTWEALRDVIERMEQQAQIFAQNVPGIENPGLSVAAEGAAIAAAGPANSSTANLPCPGDCPPATVNIFCQPHPDQTRYPGKVIAKFSSIDEATLNRLGVTQARIQSLGNNLAVIAAEAAHAVRTNIAALTPPPDPSFLGPDAAAALATLINNTLDALESAFSNLCYLALGSPQAGETYYQVIQRLVYEGLPCPDVTMTVSANVSYAGVSSLAYVRGKATLSTAGAGGVIGTVYVLGVPLGEGRVFIAATDAQGNPNPSLCGEVVVSFGPLDLGNVRILYACPGCITGVLEGLPNMLAALSDAVLYRIAARIAPDLAARNPGRAELILALLDLSVQQRAGIFAELASQPLSALPPNLPQIFFQGIANTYDAINPIVTACGEVHPKIFGLPLGSSLVSARLFATKSEEAGGFDFSPSYILGYFLPILPGSDSASLSFSYSVGDPYAFVFGGLAGGFSPDNIAAYTQAAIDAALQNTAIGIAYEIHPFGLEMASAAGRVILPDLTTHPVLPWSNWVRPEERGNTNLPSRHDLLLAALAADKLGDAVSWRGTTNDLYTIYPPGSPQRAALQGLTLSKDYFPHGGILGAARITLPAVITEKPPLDKFNVVLDTHANPLDRLTAAIDILQNYVLRFNTNGALGFYVPAPNPPLFYDQNGSLLGQSQLQGVAATLTPQGVLDAIKSFDVANIQRGSFYPMEQAFLRGYLDGQLLGVPIVRADVVGLPADANRAEGFLSITSNIPDGSWLKQFIPQATLIFDLRGVPPKPIEQRFAELLQKMQSALDTNANETALRLLADDAILALTGDLPKMRLTADLVTGLQMPAPVSDLLAFNGAAHLHAFSPRYEPTFEPTNNGPLARVRREGGIAFQGSMLLRANGADLANIANAELSLVPKDSGVPTLSGQFLMPTLSLPGVNLNDVVVDFANEPNPHFSAQGSMTTYGVGQFLVESLSSGVLTGRLDVARTGPNSASVNLALGPAKLRLPSLYDDNVLIYGATTNDPFTVSTTGPWTATLQYTSGITLGFSGTRLVTVSFPVGIGPATFTGNGTSLGSFRTSFSDGTMLTLFPDNATLRQSVTLSSGVSGSLMVSNDATFRVVVTLSSPVTFGGIAAPSGATLVVDNNGVTLTWVVNNGAATATLAVDRSGNVSFNGSADLPPLNFGIFQITGADGGNLTGSFNNDGFAVSSGAKVRLLRDWLQNQSLTLQTFTYSNNGGIQLTVTTPGNSLLLAGFPFDLTSFTFTRTPTNAGAVATLGLAGTLRASPDFVGLPSLTFTGSVSSAGAVSLKTSAASTTFFAFPVRNFTNTFTQAAGSFLGQLRSEFSLGNGAPPFWDKVAANSFSGTLNPDGSFQISANTAALPLSLANFSLNNVALMIARQAGQNASVTVEGSVAPTGFSPLRLRGGINPDGSFFLTPAPPAPSAPLPYPQLNAQVSVTLTNNGLRVQGFLNQPPLPSLSLTGEVFTTGAFSLTGAVASATINGFNLGSARFIVQRATGTGPAWVNANGNLAIPGFGTFAVTGGLTNDGTFGLSASLPNGTNVSGLPIANLGLSGGATLNWTHNGVKLSGNLGGGVLGTLLPAASVSGEIAFSTTGQKTLAATATLQPLTNGLFRIRPSSGANFIASLDNSGLTLPTGAVLEFSNYLASAASLPDIRIASDGSFSITAGVPEPLSLTMRGFSLNNVTFTLQRTAGQALSVPTFSGVLDVPRLGVTVGVNGSWNNTGTFSLAGSIANAVSLSGLGLPVGTLNANGGVMFNESSLAVSGNLAGSLFGWLPGASVGGVLTVTAPPSPTVTLSGTVTVPSLTLGAFTIRRNDNGPIQASWNNSGVVLPSTQNLELHFNGSRLGTFTLPQFTVGGNGDFNLPPFNANFALNGFNLAGVNVTFSRSAGVTSLGMNGGSLSVPGFTPALNASVGGVVRSDGTFRVTNTVAVSGDFSPINSSFGTLSGNISVVLDQTPLVVSVSGSLAGGSLAHVLGVSSVTGTLAIDRFGNITPTATVVFSQILLPDNTNGFRLAPIGGGNFTASLGPGGVTVPAGAQVFYRGVSLGSWSLPSFTIPNSGDFNISVSSADLALDGYNLPGASLQLSRAGSLTRLLVQAGSRVTLPGLNASVNVTGAITNNGTFRITGNLGGGIGLPGLPIATLNSGASAALNRSGGVTSLSLSGGLSGGALGTGVSLLNATGLVGVATSGALTLSGSVTAQPLSAGVFVIESTSGGNISATWDNNGLNFSNVRLRTTIGIFNQNITLPNFSIPFNGAVSVPVSPPNLRIAGFDCSSISFTLRRDASGIWIDPITASLAIPNFNQQLPNGYITGSGGVVLDWHGFITLGTFGAADGYLQLRNGSLSAGGTFNLSALGHVFHSGLKFGGSVNTLGRYSLSPTVPWGLSFAEVGSAATHLSLGTGSLVLTNGSIFGNDTLRFGGADIPINIPSFTSGGISVNGSVFKDTQWVKFFDTGGNFGTDEQYDVWARARGDVALTTSNDGVASATMTGRFAVWEWFPTVPAGQHTTPPGDIEQASSPGPINIPTVSVNSQGQFSISFSFNGNQFSSSSWSFDLW